MTNENYLAAADRAGRREGISSNGIRAFGRSSTLAGGPFDKSSGASNQKPLDAQLSLSPRAATRAVVSHPAPLSGFDRGFLGAVAGGLRT
jgi:hypothetical protein